MTPFSKGGNRLGSKMFSSKVRWLSLKLACPVCLQSPALFTLPYRLPRGRKGSKSKVVQLCATLCEPMDCSMSGSSIHGIFPGKNTEWVAISFSRGSS